MTEKAILNNREEFEKIPKTSGLYYFYDEHGSVLYIGKADNLHTRILAHYNNHSIDREMRFFVKMIESKGFTVKEVEKLPKELLNIWKRLEERARAHTNTLVIDLVFDKVKRITIEEMPEEETESKEKNLIEMCQPTYNSESHSKEYYKLKYE